MGACAQLAASWVATFPLTLVNLWSISFASLGDRLEVGRMTLAHATGVRILLPQPLVLNVIGYPLLVIGKDINRYSAHLSTVKHNSEYLSPTTVNL